MVKGGDNRTMSARKILGLMLVVVVMLMSMIREASGQTTDFAGNTTVNRDPYKQDAGPWFGLRCGLQTNGGSPDQRWTVSGLYELRSQNPFSILFEYQLWRNRLTAWNGVENIRLHTTLGNLNMGLKLRYNISRVSVSAQGGIGSGIGVSPVSFFHAEGVECSLGNRFALGASLKRYAFPEIRHFFFISLLMRSP